MPSWLTANVVDVLFLILAIGFAVGGYKAGFAKATGNFLSLIIGLVASYFATTFAQTIPYFSTYLSNPWVVVGFFIVCLLLVSKIIDLVFSAVGLVEKFFSILPGFGLLTSVIGALVGIIQAAAVIIGVAFLSNHVLTGAWKTLLLATKTIGFVNHWLGTWI